MKRAAVLVDVKAGRPEPEVVEHDRQLGKHREDALEQRRLSLAAVEPELVARPRELGEQRKARELFRVGDRRVAELEQAQPLQAHRLSPAPVGIDVGRAVGLEPDRSEPAREPLEAVTQVLVVVGERYEDCAVDARLLHRAISDSTGASSSAG